MEKEILEIKNFWNQKEKDKKYARVGVFGIGKERGKDDAISWLNVKLKLLADCKAEIYGKGEFNGILFAKFDSQATRDLSVESFRKASLSREGSRCWAAEDAPIEIRAYKKFLFGIKKLLISPEWGFGKFEIWVDTKKFEIYCNDDFVALIEMNSNKELEFKYGNECESYLQEGNLDEIIAKAQSMILKSTANSNNKGKGKSKSKSKSKSSGSSSQ